MKKRQMDMPGTFLVAGLLLLFLLAAPAFLLAGEVSLGWDPNTQADLAGYKLYYDGDSDTEMYQGIDANEGDSPIVIYLEDLDDPDSPAFMLTGLQAGQYYYFVLTAFDTDGRESAFSEEVGTLIDTTSGSDAAENVSGDAGSTGGTCFISGILGP